MEDGIFELTSTKGDIHYSRTIILTLGNGTIQPVKLEIEDVERYETSSLHYSVTDFSHFKDKRVVISGGGDSAIDWANELHGISKSVKVIHRRETFRALESNVEKMKETVDVLTPFTIKDVHGNEEQINQVTIEHMETGKMSTLEVDALLVNHGFIGDLGGVNNWGLKNTK